MSGLSTLRKNLTSLANDFVHIVYPNLCLACSAPLFSHERLICMLCTVKLPKTNYHLNQDNPVSKLFWGKADTHSASSYLFFQGGGKVQKVIHNFKYKGFMDIGTIIGKQFGHHLNTSPLFSEIDIIVPVPLHPFKRKTRGYNQSEYFATGLSEIMKKPTDFTSLIRNEANESQTRKSVFSRYVNTDKSFVVVEPANIEGLHVLLVDDVVTTGSTLIACVNKLNEAGAGKVSVATIACAIR